MENKPAQIQKSLILSIAVYLVWVLATYLLEGRILTLLRPEATFDRFVYTIVANIIIGILISAWVLRLSLSSKVITLENLGFRSIPRTIIAVVIAFVTGLTFIVFQGLPSSDPIVILNAYAQMLTVSVAEIMICWAITGAIFENMFSSKSRVTSIIAGMISANVLFGLYHFGHSPPFNQINMVIFLMIIATLTSLIYFFGRDIYAAIIFHNFLGTTGVMEALERSGDLSTYVQPQYPLIIMGVISLAILAGVDILYIRKKEV